MENTNRSAGNYTLKDVTNALYWIAECLGDNAQDVEIKDKAAGNYTLKDITIALGQIREGLDEGGGSGSAGYAEEDVLVDILPSQAILFTRESGDADIGFASIGELDDLDTTKSATIVWDGEPYTCEPTVDEYGHAAYGGISEQGPDFTQYPFALVVDDGYVRMYCPADGLGAHNAAIQQVEKHMSVSDGFKEAANQSVFLFLDLDKEEAAPGENVVVTEEELGATYQEIKEAYRSGKLVFLRSATSVPDYAEHSRRMVGMAEGNLDFDFMFESLGLGMVAISKDERPGQLIISFFQES